MVTLNWLNVNLLSKRVQNYEILYDKLLFHTYFFNSFG